MDLYSYRSDDMLNMFRNQNPSLKVPEKTEADLSFDYMRSLLNKGSNDKFIKIFGQFKDKNFNDDNFHEYCASFVYEAVRNGSEQVILALSAEGIDVNRRMNGVVKSPAELACSYGYYKVLSSLIKSVPHGENLLHEILHASYQNGTAKKSPKVDHQKCFEIALPFSDVNQTDDLGCTALHYAAHHRNGPAVMELLERNAFLAPKNVFGETPLDELKADVLEAALDERVELIQIPKGVEQKEVTISIDFNILRPEDGGGEVSGTDLWTISVDLVEIGENYEILIPFLQVEPLEIMSKNPELRPLIVHAVIATFIYLKWKRLSLIFYANFIAFTVLMLAFIR